MKLTSHLLAAAIAIAAMLAAYGAIADESLQAMDTNRDGVITAAEHESGARETFMRLDANHDGQITTDEMAAAHAQLGRTTADRIPTIDVNGDGAISAGEYEAGSRAQFTQMDLNRDGKLTPEERKTLNSLVKPANPG